MDRQHHALGAGDLGRRAISSVYIILEHRHLVLGSSRSSVMGSPVSEFRLPSLRRTVRVRARTSATISLAIVLPVRAGDPHRPHR